MSRRLPPSHPARRAAAHRWPAALALGVLLGVLPGACASTSEPDGALRVRVRNVGPVSMSALAVVFPRGERLESAALAPGATTPYTAVALAYRYAYVEAVVDGRRIVLQPIDYVGEQPMAGPCVTYELRAFAAERTLEIAARTEASCTAQ